MKKILFTLCVAVLFALPARSQEASGPEALTGKDIRPAYILSDGGRKQTESVSYAPPLTENERGERVLAVTNYGWEGVSYDLNDTQLYVSVSLAGPFLVEADTRGNPHLSQIFVRREVGDGYVFAPGWASPTDRTIAGVDGQDGDYISYCSADKKRYVAVEYLPCPQDNPQSCPYLHAWYVDEAKGLRRELKSKEMKMPNRSPAPGNTAYCDGKYFYFTADRLEDKARGGCMRGIWVYDLTDDMIYEFLADPFVYNGKNGFRSYAQDPVGIPGTDYIFYLRRSWGEENEAGETSGAFMRLSAKKKFTRPEVLKNKSKK